MTQPSGLHLIRPVLEACKLRAPLDGERFEVAVVGGGINGVAIARQCARAGKRTLLVEQNDFGSGTTSRSTRIIHGGLRYLEHGEIGLVRESLRERERLLTEHPHLVRPLTFVLALDQELGRRSALEVRLGLWLYHQLGGRAAARAGVDVTALERSLDAGRRWNLFQYDDAQCEFPERLVAEWLADAQAAGAVARNHTQVLQAEIRDGRVRGLRLRDRFSGREFRVEAHWIINATGPWADQFCRQSGISTAQPMIGGIRGSHLVLPKFAGAPPSALYSEAADGRPVFVIPWNGQILVGTTELPDDGDPGRTQPTFPEVEYLLASARKLFPHAQLSWADVRYAFAGVRPLPFAPGQEPARVSRRHLLHHHAGEGAAGLISLIGGKLTTAASVARECARQMGLRAIPPEPVLVAAGPADGLEPAISQWALLVARMANLPVPTARALAEWHGRRALCVARLAASDARLRLPLCAHTPHIVAEAVEAMRHEGALTLGDVLLRRVPVALGACWSDECRRQAANAVASAVGWSEREREAELDAFEAERASFLTRLDAPAAQRSA
jgi:glycerol-3-phosphate dehydrogenase